MGHPRLTRAHCPPAHATSQFCLALAQEVVPSAHPVASLWGQKCTAPGPISADGSGVWDLTRIDLFLAFRSLGLSTVNPPLSISPLTIYHEPRPSTVNP